MIIIHYNSRGKSPGKTPFIQLEGVLWSLEGKVKTQQDQTRNKQKIIKYPEESTPTEIVEIIMSSVRLGSHLGSCWGKFSDSG